MQNAGEVFEPPVNSSSLLDQLDSVLDDKDTFLIKLPHKFKEYLTDPETKQLGYSMTYESQTIGKVVQNNQVYHSSDIR